MDVTSFFFADENYVPSHTPHKLLTLLKTKLRSSFNKWNGLVVLTEGNSIIIWDIFSDKRVQELTGHTDLVFKVLQLQSGQLVSSGDDDTIRLWDWQLGKCDNILILSSTSYRTMIKEVRDGIVLSENVERENELWSMRTGSLIHSFLRDLKIDYDDHSMMLSTGLLAAVNDCDIFLVDPTTFKIAATLTASYSVDAVVEMYPELLVASSKKLQFWNLKTNTCERTVDLDGTARALVTVNSELFAAATTECVGIFNRQGERIRHIDIDHPNNIMQAGQYLLTVTSNEESDTVSVKSTIQLWTIYGTLIATNSFTERVEVQCLLY
jgi:WD40 repeat protein